MLQACADQQIDYVGLNFVPTSKRRLTGDLDLDVYDGKIVGLFQNTSLEDILEQNEVFDFDVIQLHGEEDLAFVGNLKLKGDFKIWKAFVLDQNFELDLLSDYNGLIDMALIDGSVPGSGKPADEVLLKKTIEALSDMNLGYGIAGGISAGNISSFVNEYPQAMLMDTASGVEVGGDFSEDTLRDLVDNFKDV